MAWEAWVVPTWEYPAVPTEVDFQSLLVPTVDSTRALAVIHHLQVGWSAQGGRGGVDNAVAEIPLTQYPFRDEDTATRVSPTTGGLDLHPCGVL